MRVFLLAILAVAANAFVHTPRFAKTTFSTTVRAAVLSEDETQAIFKAAEECAESECTVDDVSALIYDLKEQRDSLTKRMTKVNSIIVRLEKLSKKPEENRDEIKQFVADLLRVFDQSKPRFPMNPISSFDGPFDAYDVLEPKPWKDTTP